MQGVREPKPLGTKFASSVRGSAGPAGQARPRRRFAPSRRFGRVPCLSLWHSAGDDGCSIGHNGCLLERAFLQCLVCRLCWWCLSLARVGLARRLATSLPALGAVARCGCWPRTRASARGPSAGGNGALLASTKNRHNSRRVGTCRFGDRERWAAGTDEVGASNAQPGGAPFPSMVWPAPSTIGAHARRSAGTWLFARYRSDSCPWAAYPRAHGADGKGGGWLKSQRF